MNSLINSEIKFRYVFASCDEIYFKEHGRAFIDSCKKHGERAYINIVSDKTVEELKSEFGDDFNLSVLHNPHNSPDRVYYACSRFFKMQSILSTAPSDAEYLIVDIDSFLRKPIDWEDFHGVDYSIFKREPLPSTVDWERHGTHVAAGAVYVRKTALNFIEYVNSTILGYGRIWFVDQVALWEAHKTFSDQLKWRQMPKKYIDWDFSLDSVIWSGKGERKRSEFYLSERDKK